MNLIKTTCKHYINQLEQELAEFNTSKMSWTVKSQTNLPVKICHLNVYIIIQRISNDLVKATIYTRQLSGNSLHAYNAWLRAMNCLICMLKIAYNLLHATCCLKLSQLKATDRLNLIIYTTPIIYVVIIIWAHIKKWPLVSGQQLGEWVNSSICIQYMYINPLLLDSLVS